MKYLFAIILLLPVISVNAQKTTKPNIIFIFADDLGYGDIGCYGQQKIETPNIDKLAQKGMRFTQFYSGSTVCAPARSSFLTGLHTGHTAIRGNKPYAPEGQTPLPDSIITFANLLQQNGYATAAFGKWGLGFINNSGDPNNFGGKEVSGTSLFIYGFAWGINNNILDKKIYLPAITKAWVAMSKEAVHSNGKLGYVQGTGKEPKDGQPVNYDSTPDFEDYGLGCFLLAGTEIYKMK